MGMPPSRPLPTTTVLAHPASVSQKLHREKRGALLMEGGRRASTKMRIMLVLMWLVFSSSSKLARFARYLFLSKNPVNKLSFPSSSLSPTPPVNNNRGSYGLPRLGENVMFRSTTSIPLMSTTGSNPPRTLGTKLCRLKKMGRC